MRGVAFTSQLLRELGRKAKATVNLCLLIWPKPATVLIHMQFLRFISKTYGRWCHKVVQLHTGLAPEIRSGSLIIQNTLGIPQNVPC